MENLHPVAQVTAIICIAVVIIFALYLGTKD